MKKFLIAGAATAALAFAGSAHAFPAFGADTGPGVILTYTNAGVSTTSTGQGPYDSVEDTYVGVVNNSTHTIFSQNLSSTQSIGGFDGDGIDTFGAPGNATDTTGYGGPNDWFTNNLGTSLTVNFGPNGLAPGATDYFSLEESVSVNNLSVPEPTTWAMMLVGVAALGGMLRVAGRKAVTA